MKKWEKYTIFLPPLNFYQFFLSQVRKKLDQEVRYYTVLFLLKLISKKLSKKEGKVNTIQHGQGENIDKGEKH